MSVVYVIPKDKKISCLNILILKVETQRTPVNCSYSHSLDRTERLCHCDTKAS